MNTVESFTKVDEVDEQRSVPFNALFNDIPLGKDLIDDTSATFKTCLFLP